MIGGSISNHNSRMSDDSDMDMENLEEDKYHRKYQLLLDRCDSIQQDNEKMVHRIQHVKKLLSRTHKEIKFLQKRLDSHGDDWRNAAVEEDVKPIIPVVIPPVTIKTEKNIVKSDKNSIKSTDKAIKIEGDKTKPIKKGTKRKSNRSEKAEKDPNAPKRPANAFFQFCQEQRQILMEQLNSELKPGEPEPSKQELTRQLAVKWKSLSGQDKKIYVDMYERSKEKYAVEMSAYNCKN